jgi:hypothetical protein
MQAIAMAFDVGRTQLTLLEAPEEGECEIADVYDAVTSNRAGLFWRRLVHSAVFVWGEVFERGGAVYTQTYMRVFWTGKEDTVRVRIPLPAQKEVLEFAGRFPSSTISFPPRRLPSAALAQISTAVDRLQPRTDADPAAPAVAMPKRFAVSAWRGGWIRLTAEDGQESWLSKEEIARGTAGLLPEMEFVRAVTAYLQYTVTHSGRSARIAVEALRSFEQQHRDPRQRSIQQPLAIADVILGMLGQARLDEAAALRESGAAAATPPVAPDQETLTAQFQGLPMDAGDAPERRYAQAATRTPADADVLTLSALAKLPDCCTGARARQRVAEITESLTTARRLDSANPAAAANLLNWYRILGGLDDALLPFPRREIAERASRLGRAIAAP